MSARSMPSDDRAAPDLILETLASARSTRRQVRFAAGVCVVAALVSAGLIPMLRAPMPSIPGFLALSQGSLTIVSALTAWVFLAQYRRARAASLLVLAAGGMFTTAMVVLQLACFPGVLAPGLWLGSGAPTLTWLWCAWHLGPPVCATIYAILEGDAQPHVTPPGDVRATAYATIAAVGLAAIAVGALLVRFAGVLPAVADADGGYAALTTSGVGPALLAITALSLALLVWRTRLRTVLQLWLGVSLFLLLLDNAITDYGAARVTMGWFVGRLEALLAGLVILGVYLQEVDYLYRRAEAAARAGEAARAEAQAARENLEIALEASGMGDWELDLATDTSRRTLRHDRVFGYAEVQDDWGRERFMGHVLPEDRYGAGAAFDRAVHGGKLELECRIRRTDGQIRWIAVLGRTSHDPAGRPVTIAGCVMDVTERRQTEERLRQAERMEAIGQLTGGVAHDFNNLLTVMLGSLDMISRRPGDTERVQRLASAALAAGRRGTDLTDKLLAFSRRQMVEPETVNLNRVITEFAALLGQAVGPAVTVSLELDPVADPARLDQSQFQAALLNLAGNARDAMAGGGTLRVSTANVTLTAPDAEGHAHAKPGHFVRVTVADTGPGMDAATAARAFEPFFTTKDVGRGTGLGLSQVYGFATQAGGHCAVRTAPGEGCSVELYLPRAIGAADGTPPAGNVVPLRRARGGEVVLVVEDEDLVREMAAESLGQLGYGVLTAPDARAALDLLRGPSRVDILFSDVVMPGGMNGAQLAVEAGRVRPGLRVLLTSGYQATAAAGARDLPPGVKLLRKPYLREDLAAKIEAVMGG